MQKCVKQPDFFDSQIELGRHIALGTFRRSQYQIVGIKVTIKYEKSDFFHLNNDELSIEFNPILI